MGESINWSNRRGKLASIRLLQDPEDIPIRTGKMFMEVEMFGGLNRTPVDRHMDFITAGSTIAEPELVTFSLNDIALRRLRDGNMVWFAGGVELGEMDAQEARDAEDLDEGAAPTPAAGKELATIADPALNTQPVTTEADIPGAWLDHLFFVSDTRVEQWLPTGHRRVFQKTGSGWAITLWEPAKASRPGDAQFVLTEEDAVGPDDVLAFPFGDGLFHRHAQLETVALSEILDALRKHRVPGSIGRVIIGYTDERTKEAVEAGGSWLALPSGTQVVNVSDATVVGNYINEYRLRKPEWLALMHLVDVGDQGTESGAAKQIKLFPMLAYRDDIRTDLDMVLAAFNTAAKWEDIALLDAAELVRRLALLAELFASGLITAVEFLAESRKLAGFDPAPVGMAEPQLANLQIGSTLAPPAPPAQPGKINPAALGNGAAPNLR